MFSSGRFLQYDFLNLLTSLSMMLYCENLSIPGKALIYLFNLTTFAQKIDVVIDFFLLTTVCWNLPGK